MFKYSGELQMYDDNITLSTVYHSCPFLVCVCVCLCAYIMRSDGGQDPFFKLANMFTFQEVYRDGNIRCVLGTKIPAEKMEFQ
jgi:hypothetical protein